MSNLIKIIEPPKKNSSIQIESNEPKIKIHDNQSQQKDNKLRKSILKSSQLQQNIIQKVTKIDYKPLYYKERKIILEEVNIDSSIQLAYALVKRNRNKLLHYMRREEILTDPEEDYQSDSIAFRYFLDYYCNYLLLILLLIKNKDIQNASVAFNHLFHDTDNVFLIEKFIDSIIKKSFDSACVFYQAKDITDYSNYLSSLIQCSYQIKKNFLYELCVLKYINFIENIPDSQMVLPYLYFYLGELFIDKDYLSIAELCYDKVNELLRENELLFKAIHYQISALYNKGLICYIKNKVGNAISLLNEAKSLKLKEAYSHKKHYKEFDQTPDEQLIQIYLTIAEIDTDHLEQSFNNLQSLLKFEVNKNKSNESILTNSSKIIISSLLEGMGLKKKCDFVQYSHSSHSNTICQRINNEDSFLNFCVAKPKQTRIKDTDMQEFEKFFLFMTKLSVYQVELLNKEQPDINDMKKKASLPIYFSNNFKQSLSLELRMELNKIKFLSLKRKSILRNPNKEISLDNFELGGLYNNSSNNSMGYNCNTAEMKNTKMVKEKVNEYVRNKNLMTAKEMQKYYLSINNNTANQPKTDEWRLMRTDSLPEFIHQQWVSYELFKKEIMVYIVNNLPKCKAEDLIKDYILITLMNRMSLDEINSIRSDPQCLIDILLEYKEKNEQNNSMKEIETEKDQQRNIEQNENSHIEESFSDKNDNHQLNNQSIDAMDIGKDE